MQHRGAPRGALRPRGVRGHGRARRRTRATSAPLPPLVPPHPPPPPVARRARLGATRTASGGAATRSERSAAWQAARRGRGGRRDRRSTRTGSSVWQRSRIPSASASPDATSGQRGWNRQPSRDARRVGRLAPQDLRLHALDLGHDAQQRPRVRVLRVVEHLLGRAELDDAAEVHHRDAVGDVPREPEVVGDDQHRDLGLVDELEHQAQDLAAHRRVEAARPARRRRSATGRARWRPRSRRAGAARPRSRAGSAGRTAPAGAARNGRARRRRGPSRCPSTLWIRRPSATDS